jgi:hypothetical protein
MSPTRDPIRSSLTSEEGVEGLSRAYSIPLLGIPLWIRKGAVSGRFLRYGSDPRNGVGCARCESLG